MSRLERRPVSEPEPSGFHNSTLKPADKSGYMKVLWILVAKTVFLTWVTVAFGVQNSTNLVSLVWFSPSWVRPSGLLVNPELS